MLGETLFPVRHPYKDSYNAPSIVRRGKMIRTLVKERKRTPSVLRAVKGYKRKKRR